MRYAHTPIQTSGTLRRRLLTTACVVALLVTALLVSLSALAQADPVSFPDVPAANAYHDAIVDLATRSIVSGFADGTFGPNKDVTRQQFAKMAVLTGGYPVSEADVCTFVDVPKTDASTLYPDNYIAVCAAAGITTGKTATTFDPTGNITRYQVTSMVVRMADDLHPGLLATPPADYAGSAGWGNDPTHSANALRAEYDGLLTGLPLATLNPSDSMPRGEVAQVLHNFLLKTAPITTTTSESATTTASTSTTSSTTTSSTTTTVPAVSSPGYESHGGLALAPGSGPAVASWGVDRLDVFARGADGHLWWKHWNGAAWTSWQVVPGGEIVASDPAAVSWGPNQIDLVAQGSDNALWHAAWSGTTWSPWERIGGYLTSAPAVCSRFPGSLEVFARGAFNFLYFISYDGGVWGTWNLLAAHGVASAPAAVSSDYSTVDVFATGFDNALWRSHWNGSWSDPESLGGTWVSGPAAASWWPGRLDVFVRGQDWKIHTSTYTPSGWTSWTTLSGALLFQGDPDAVSWGPGRIDLFADGVDGALYQKTWAGSTWVP
jgi:hypothetical protein